MMNTSLVWSEHGATSSLACTMPPKVFSGRSSSPAGSSALTAWTAVLNSRSLDVPQALARRRTRVGATPPRQMPRVRGAVGAARGAVAMHPESEAADAALAELGLHPILEALDQLEHAVDRALHALRSIDHEEYVELLERVDR